MLKPLASLALSISLIAPVMAGPVAETSSLNFDTSANVSVVSTHVTPTEPVAPIEKTEAKEKAADVDTVIAEIKEIGATSRPDIKWGKEFKDLFKTLYELKDELIAISTGNVPAFDTTTILSRAKLAAKIGQAINTGATTLRNKVQAAHVKIGFAVTRSIIRLTNLSSTEAQLNESTDELGSILTEVADYPNLTPEDNATIYVRNELTQKIWKTRWDRDTNILRKKSFATYNKLNRNITKAVGIELGPRSTVKQVREAVTALDNAYKEALVGE